MELLKYVGVFMVCSFWTAICVSIVLERIKSNKEVNINVNLLDSNKLISEIDKVLGKKVN